VAGDVVLAKGPEDEFECVIDNVKPGPWTVTRLSDSDDAPDGDEGDENDGDDEGENQGVVKVVMQHSAVSKDALESVAWEDVSTFSVDGGTWCLHSLQEIEKMASGSGDREAAIECLVDWAMDVGPKMPGGVVGMFNLYFCL
jgi:hypothetical protein